MEISCDVYSILMIKDAFRIGIKFSRELLPCGDSSLLIKDILLSGKLAGLW